MAKLDPLNIEQFFTHSVTFFSQTKVYSNIIITSSMKKYRLDPGIGPLPDVTILC